MTPYTPHLFWDLLQLQQQHPLAKLWDLPKEARLSLLFDLSGIQESIRFRALNRARLLSVALLDEKGEVGKEFLKPLISLLENEGYFFFPGGTNDSLIRDHQLHFLRALNADDTLLKSLKRFKGPLCNRWAERLIFETLGIYSPPSSSPSEPQIKAAVLCACMTPLYQNVGSCFATAPAILIQKDQIPLLLDDLYQLLHTGKLKRTFEGVEYAVPLSLSTGIGDLRKNLLSSTQTHPGFNPGLIAALEIAGLLNPQSALEEKGEAVQRLIQKLALSKTLLTAEDLIRTLLLQQFNLNEEELEKGKSLEKMQLKSFRPDLSVLRKLDTLSSFHERHKECRAAFKGSCDNALLRAWEFTLASFSEVKMEFSSWNLYSSLGLSPTEPGGIGELLHRAIEEKIAEFNKELQKLQAQYEIAFDQVRATESLLRNSSSESSARRLQAEHQSRAYHLRACLEMRDATYAKGAHYSNLFSFLLNQFDQKFPEYFQEIYDAEMHDLRDDNSYNDSPAGFRLVYKQGRTDPSLWTLIYDGQGYIDALFDFFSAVQSQIASNCDWEGAEAAIAELIAATVLHIRTERFLETALQRMAKAHLAPLSKQSSKKPWAYTSGGTVTTLLKTYYCRTAELTQEEKWVESDTELLIFILDTLKNLPPRNIDPYLKGKRSGMLMGSPSHVFLLLPAEEGVKKGWQEEIFTYTWVRDELLLPSQKFYSDMQLLPEEQAFLLSKFVEQLPSLSHYVDRVYAGEGQPLSIMQWRNKLLASARVNTAQKQMLESSLDAFLFQTLPIVPSKEYKACVRKLLPDLMMQQHEVDAALQRLPEPSDVYVTSQEVKEAAKGCYLCVQKNLFLSFDLHDYIAHQARACGLAPPKVLLFANTNWVGNYFGFIVNPGTSRLELWRLDKTLSHGVPMSAWRQWLSGSDRKTWSIFTAPQEYS